MVKLHLLVLSDLLILYETVPIAMCNTLDIYATLFGRDKNQLPFQNIHEQSSSRLRRTKHRSGTATNKTELGGDTLHGCWWFGIITTWLTVPR